MSKKFYLLAFALLSVNFLFAQTEEELKTQKAEKEAQIGALQGEVDAINKQIAAFPGWDFGAFGTIGANFQGFNNWYTKDAKSSFSTTLGLTGNVFANLQQDKYFWRNSLNINVATQKFDNKDSATDTLGFETVSDIFSLTSLFGYKLTEKIAISTLGEYRTSFISNFNNPGYLDIGLGATWTPIQNMVVVFHPLNYNIVFSKGDSDYTSSLGCKIVADYTQQLPRGISWKSNLTAFLSYKDIPNLSNWQWTNGLSFAIWKGIGVGIDFGLRQSKQENYNFGIANQALYPDVDFEDEEGVKAFDENKIQSFWLIGLTYSL